MFCLVVVFEVYLSNKHTMVDHPWDVSYIEFNIMFKHFHVVHVIVKKGVKEDIDRFYSSYEIVSYCKRVGVF